MDSVLMFFKALLDLGSVILLPLVIFIIALFFRLKFGNALMSALKIAIGFTLINVVLGVLLGAVIPVTQAMTTRAGLQLTTIDVGWGALSGIAFASQMGLLIIPLFLLVNVILIAVKWTKTFNIDIWNFWHIAFVAAMVQIVTGSFVAGIVVAIGLIVLLLKVADLTQKDLSEWMGIPGVSVTTLNMVAQFFLTKIFNKIYSVILPKKKKAVSWDSNYLREKFGILGDPILQGALIGIILGVLAGFDVKATVTLGITIAAGLYLLPKVIAALMEGLVPIAEGAKAYFKSRYSDREIFIGVDWILLLKPEHFSFGLPFIPISIALAFLLPGNKVLPLGDLALVWAGAFVSFALFKGDMVKSFFVALFTLIIGFYIATWNAPFITQAAVAAGTKLPAGATSITGLLDSMDYVQNGIIYVAKLIGGLIH
jgi:galactitol PTS system EIIC component